MKLGKRDRLVLAYLLLRSSEFTYGYDIMETCKLSSGGLYLSMKKFHGHGWIQWHKSSGVDSIPPRSYYRLNKQGIKSARILFGLPQEG